MPGDTVRCSGELVEKAEKFMLWNKPLKSVHDGRRQNVSSLENKSLTCYNITARFEVFISKCESINNEMDEESELRKLKILELVPSQVFQRNTPIHSHNSSRRQLPFSYCVGKQELQPVQVIILVTETTWVASVKGKQRSNLHMSEEMAALVAID